MKTRSTRLLYVPAAAALMAVLALAAPQHSTGQALPEEPDLETVVAALTEQTAQMANQQVALEAKLDHVAEMVRQARIYAARGGAAKK